MLQNRFQFYGILTFNIGNRVLSGVDTLEVC